MFKIGHPDAPPAGSRARFLRQGEVAVRTAERLSFGGSSGGLALGPRVWTWEGWVRPASWPKSSTTHITANLIVAPNAELKITNNAGNIDATASFWTETSAGVASEHAITAFNLPITTTWQHLCLQANYATGTPPTFAGAVWLDGVLKGSTAPVLANATIPHSRRFHFGLLEGVADVDIDPTPQGDIAFDNWRLSNDDRHTLANFTPPVAAYDDLTSPTILIWGLRETTLPYFVQSNAGVARREWGILRYSAWGDEYRGPWTLTPNGVAAPF